MFKRLFDIIISGLFIVLFLPLYIMLSIIIFIFIGRPILFKQDRPGLDEEMFTIYKFRTMSNERDSQGDLLSDEKRLKSIGKFIRSTSLDELPQLLNIFKGDMSLVGPRPLLCEYLSLYNDEQKKRHSVKPGITGWAQVNGRNTISWDEKFKYDIWYVQNYSFFLDIKILWMTFFKVVNRSGISSGDTVTMEKFKGNNDE